MDRYALRARRLVVAYWDTAGSGRFFTRWSAIVSFPVAALLLVPDIDDGNDGYVPGIVVGVFAWTLLALPVLAVAGAERRIRDRRMRGILVTATLLLIALARPALNDALVSLMFHERSGGVWLTRVGTNLFVVFALFPLVALITVQYEQTRATVERLARALGRLDAANEQLRNDERNAPQLVQDIVDELRAERDKMLDGMIDFDAVRAFSEKVRAASHRLEGLAGASMPVPALWASRETVATNRRGLERLQPTPLLSVGAIYLVMCAPFLLTTAGFVSVAAAAFSIILIDLAVGAILRAVPVHEHRTRGRMFLLLWILAGTAATAIGNYLFPDVGALIAIPVVAIPLGAVVLALAIDTRRHARAEEERSTRALALATRAFADREQRAHAPLRQAVSALHGRLQARCVIFAAHVDESAPTTQEIARFRAETDCALDEVIAPSGPDKTGVSQELRLMLAGWEPLMDLDTRIEESAVDVVERVGIAPIVTELVNEALVNAVKHSGARAARIAIATDTEGALQVRVASAGTLPRAVMPMRPFARRALLYQEGDDVVFESTVPAPVPVRRI